MLLIPFLCRAEKKCCAQSETHFFLEITMGSILICKHTQLSWGWQISQKLDMTMCLRTEYINGYDLGNEKKTKKSRTTALNCKLTILNNALRLKKAKVKWSNRSQIIAHIRKIFLMFLADRDRHQ